VTEIIQTADFESAFGMIKVATSDRGLAYVGLPLVNGRGFTSWLQRYGDGAHFEANYSANLVAIQQINDFIEGKRDTFDVDLDLRATDFQRQVYRVTQAIPFGETMTYAEVAEATGRPTATRAVGAALGANPLPLVIPCHRVVGARGKLQGYAGGLEVKARLLAGERLGPSSGRLF